MKALQWLKHLFVVFLTGLREIGEQSHLPSSSDSILPTSPKSPAPPTTASITKRKSAKKLTGAKADFQHLLDEAGIRYFTADEVFFRGARDAKLQLNTDPPRALWPSLLAVTKVADEARHRLG